MGPQSKNMKNVAKTTLKGVKKLFGGGFSSGDAVGRKRQRAEGLTALACRGDHLEKEVLEVPKVDSSSEDSIDSDTNVGLDVNMDKGKSTVEEESEESEEEGDEGDEEEDEQDDDVEEYVVEDVPPMEEAPVVLDFVRKSNNDLEFQRCVYGGGPYKSELLYECMSLVMVGRERRITEH